MLTRQGGALIHPQGRRLIEHSTRALRVDVADVQVIPYLVVHVIPWLAVDVLSRLCWCRQVWWFDDVSDLCGEVFGGGAAESDGDDGLAVAAA
jgi:hypothetical protein